MRFGYFSENISTCISINYMFLLHISGMEFKQDGVQQ